jgi:hypothetical protein
MDALDREIARNKKAAEKAVKAAEKAKLYTSGNLFLMAMNPEQRLRYAKYYGDMSIYPVLNDDQKALYEASLTLSEKAVNYSGTRQAVTEAVSTEVTLAGNVFTISLAQSKAESVVFCQTMRRKTLYKLNGQRIAEADAFKLLETK